MHTTSTGLKTNHNSQIHEVKYEILKISYLQTTLKTRRVGRPLTLILDFGLQILAYTRPRKGRSEAYEG